MKPLFDTIFAVVDTEATGVDVEKDQVIELSAVVTDSQHVRGMWSTLVRPTIPVPAEASAIHGLTDADLIDGEPFQLAVWRFNHFMSAMHVDMIAAKNAKYDAAMLGQDPASWLCIERLAKHLYPDAPNYKNQTLRYWLPGISPTEFFGISPHRGLGDALVSANILRYVLLNRPTQNEELIESAEALLEFANSKILVKNMPLGKHKGMNMHDVPTDYIEWCLGPRGLTDIPDDDDLKYTLWHELRARTGVLPL